MSVSFSWETKHKNHGGLKQPSLLYPVILWGSKFGLGSGAHFFCWSWLGSLMCVSPVSWWLDELDGLMLISETLAGRTRMTDMAGPLSICSLIL